MSGFATMTRVCLTVESRAWQPELAGQIGQVLECGELAARVSWPNYRVSWHRIEDLEPAT